MGLDIRLAIGSLFLVIGAILCGAGLSGGPKTLAGVTPGINIDLIWGTAMAVFGLVMLLLAALARRRR